MAWTWFCECVCVFGVRVKEKLESVVLIWVVAAVCEFCVVHTRRTGGSCAFYGNCLHARMPSWSQAQHATEALWKCNQSAPTGVPQFISNWKSQNWPKEIGEDRAGQKHQHWFAFKKKNKTKKTEHSENSHAAWSISENVELSNNTQWHTHTLRDKQLQWSCAKRNYVKPSTSRLQDQVG